MTTSSAKKFDYYSRLKNPDGYGRVFGIDLLWQLRQLKNQEQYNLGGEN
jgi:hypothetical protein